MRENNSSATCIFFELVFENVRFPEGGSPGRYPAVTSGEGQARGRSVPSVLRCDPAAVANGLSSCRRGGTFPAALWEVPYLSSVDSPECRSRGHVPT